MVEKLKNFLKKIGIFKYYMYVKNKLYYAKKLQRIEEEQKKLRKDFYATIIKPGDLVFDVGANVGNRTEIFLDLNAKVVAIEPQPNCANILKEKFGNQISLEQVGLDEQDGTLNMFVADESTISTFSEEYVSLVKETRFKRNKWEQKLQVKVIRMDELINKYSLPAFCKIDVEGYELNVLKGLSKSIPLISFEYCVPELNDKLIACIRYLSILNTNYKFNYSIGESMKFEIPEWLTFNDMMQEIKKPQFIKSEFGDVYVKLFN